MEVRHVTVIGAGQMGAGIAQVVAQAQIPVAVRDIEDRFLARGRDAVQASLARLVKKGALNEQQADAAAARITWTTDLDCCRSSDIVIEAAIERMDVKRGIFAEVDRRAPQSAVLASNTSSLSITELAGGTQRPEQVIGMHFMNPVPVMPLVEMIRGLQTSDDTYARTEALARAVGKTPIAVRDFPGFISNRVLMPMINEAIYCVYEGVAQVEAIDGIMKLGMNHPMGPLTLADFIGLDTCLYIMEVLYEGFGDSKYRPCPLLRKYVEAGWLGKKSGRGFYNYA
ncbi:MAG: 3-hydroxybutyryl-CoA dehydrogenase [Firmicutes bacterium]|nr:3-hydroxybutyryl-CoA dehydrogenase [Bacillota bacterium]